MEHFGLYLLQSASWLSGFALIYLIFLRNERFFEVNRVYLITGLLASFFLPFISISYPVIISYEGSIESAETYVSGIAVEGADRKSFISFFLWGLYLPGIVMYVGKSIAQNHSVLKTIKGSDIIPYQPAKLIRTHEYPSSFSFFSFVFVNPSITDIETNEILNHELVHIRQKHWIDLILAELLCIMQWFNPLVWMYSKMIKQNHEYLADKVALQRTSDPAVYKATLLNQILGHPVVNLANSFNYSLNNKRFNMMKNKISSPYRKLKLLFILPVFAIILYSFAKPEYKQTSTLANPEKKNIDAGQEKKVVKGYIVRINNEPLTGASIVISGSTIGTVSDPKGFFKLENVSEDSRLVISYVGFKTLFIKPEFTGEMLIKMVHDTVDFGTVTINPSESGEKKSIKEDEGDIKSAPETASPDITNSDSEVFYVVEDMPKFNGGGLEEMQKWVMENTKYPEEAVKNKISGRVFISLVINAKGEVTDVQVLKSIHPLLDAEAVRVISSMPDWKPGSQRGKPVSVQYTTVVDFILKP